MNPTTPADRLARARADDSARRRRRVLAALDDLTRDGQPISVSSVARLAGVHRSLIYRHADLHAAVLTRAAQLPDGPTGPQVSRQSLLTDLANLTDRNTRLTAHVARLEQRLSEALGHEAWQATGLGAPGDTNALEQQVALLEQQIADLRDRLTESNEDLQAARATNRELMAQLNSPVRRPL
ncbi:hypothetical protein ACFRQM_41830 [Streptomyces sp. NPDC056831]|uniref:hypothetical protein n=1 Tax=Streptomyces sp. NPDC056831 TaxID=3345954 RepID=UPI0036C344CF